MITDIELTNFRRHEYTHIKCEPGEQVIAVCGRNGAGKSSIFEAVQLALFGESRGGLDRMVRRGAELEGMEVAVSFTLGGEHYRVARRRDSKASSAVLDANGLTVVSGVRAVNAAVQELLGTDGAGWRLATYARQKELDALSKLGDTARSRAIAKLLKLDALTRASTNARAQYRTASDIVAALDAADPDAARQEVEVAQVKLVAVQASEENTRSAVEQLRAELKDGVGVEERFNEAVRAQERVNGEIAGVESSIARLAAERDRLIQDPGQLADAEAAAKLGELSQLSRDLDIDIARSEGRRKQAQQRSSTETLLAGVRSDLAKLADSDVKSGTASDLGREIEALTTQREVLHADIEGLRAQRETLLELHAGLRVRCDAAGHAAEAADCLTDTCEQCGQGVDGETRERLLTIRQAAFDAANSELEAAGDAGRKAAAALTLAVKQRDALTQQLTELETRHSVAAGREGERTALLRQEVNYVNQLERIPETEDDLDDLLETRGRVAADLGKSQAAAEQQAAEALTAERVAELSSSIASTESRRCELIALAQRSGPDAALETAAGERKAAEERLVSELQLLGDMRAATATATVELKSANERLEHAGQRAAKRTVHMNRAVAGEGAHRLLVDVEKHLGAQIQPSLEAAVSDLLAQLSDGRFTAMHLSSSYEVRVDDNGVARAIEDLSGGEADLVALAVRLGLAELVANRSDGGMGVLVLDEILGSQDAERRTTIMSTLRNLRSRYEQIFCISHVGGVEDVADRVIDVSVDDDHIAQVEA